MGTEIDDLTAELIRCCLEREIMVTTAESCTGGMIAAALTDPAGASSVFDRGVVTYSNAAKTALLEVPADQIIAHGAVSETVARAMAEGALRKARADAPKVALALAVTGIAGPSGGSEEKPVGRVHLAAATPEGCLHRQVDFGALGRDGVRRASVAEALRLGLKALGEER